MMPGHGISSCRRSAAILLFAALAGCAPMRLVPDLKPRPAQPIQIAGARGQASPADGSATYDAMLAAIGAARRHINMETYILRDRQIVRAIGSSPREAHSAIYSTLMSSIEHAEKEILITTAYFVPDPQLLAALCDAAQRKVDVKMILPRHTDAPLVLSAGRSHYGTLLRAGVKLYERRSVLLHSKTAVVDGVWSTVGSTNLDWRSFVHNLELNAVVLGGEFGKQMQTAFARDLAESDPITLEAWEQRPLSERLAEVMGRMIEYWL